MDDRDVKILWITLCKSEINAQHIDAVNKNIRILKAHDAIDKKQIESVITSIKPNLICIDYDFPDLPGLQLLRQIRSNYSSIPVIMLTTQHSESLAVWAFRTGTRNYFVKPLRTNSLIEEINLLATQFNPEFCRPRINLLKHYLIPQEFHYFSKSLLSKRTVLATNYVEAHFHEKIREIEMASICGMGIFTFSRTFRIENAITFREFLTRYRIMQASEFLHNPQITISDVAQLSGFSDTSSFARLFRRYMGIAPSHYQKNLPLDRFTLDCRFIRHFRENNRTRRTTIICKKILVKKQNKPYEPS